MQRQPVRDTVPEVKLRRELHRLGLRYRLHRQVVPGTRRSADIIFGPARVAVFVDGCFWHSCPDHANRAPKVNDWYWPGKLSKNSARDRDTDSRLQEAGWTVVRVWEHDDPVEQALLIASVVRSRRPG